MTDLETIKQAAQRLKEARAKATQGEWRKMGRVAHNFCVIQTGENGPRAWIPGRFVCSSRAVKNGREAENVDRNFDFIALAANSADPFADALIKLAEAAQEIAKKEPRKVNRNEAADMACEFSDIVRNALREVAESLKGLG